MPDATTDPGSSFADRIRYDERDQADARAATAEQERDEALEERDEAQRVAANLREQLDRANLARQHAQEQLDATQARLDHIAEALRNPNHIEDLEETIERWYQLWPDSAVTSPHYGLAQKILHDLADVIVGPDPAAASVPSRRAQDAWPSAEETARLFHNTYEKLAPEHGYQTREASRVPWSEVPEQNRALMVATCAKLLDWLRRGASGGRPVEPPARAFLGEPVCDKPDCPCRAPKLATSAPVEKPLDLHFDPPVQPGRRPMGTITRQPYA